MGSLARKLRRKLAPQVSRQPGPQIAFGVACTWWDDLAKVGRLPGPKGIPCCPFRSGLAYQTDAAKWEAYAHQQQLAAPDDALGLIAFMRGKCFPSREAALAAYVKEPRDG